MKPRLELMVLLASGLLVAPLLDAESRWDLAAEWVEASDVSLAQLSANRRWELKETAWSGDISFAANGYGMDYVPVPFDFLGEARRLEELSLALQGVGRYRWRENFEWTLTAGIYDGYTNYRSIWLAEFYRQQFEDRQGVPGVSYEQPDPRGGGGGVGFRWEYLRASGYLEVLASARRDEVAPGYEIDFEGLRRGRALLNGTSLSVATENILSPRMRSRVEVRASRVSEREWRLGGEAALNVALGESVVMRLVGGGATEEPQFGAWYGGLTLDWAVNDSWAFFTEVRRYEDTGEIENALLFTSAAPGLESSQASVGVRWGSGNSSWRLKIGRSESDYASPDPRLDFFQNLYADRRWTLLQLSYARTF
jgi:hypothetical protein